MIARVNVVDDLVRQLLPVNRVGGIERVTQTTLGVLYRSAHSDHPESA